MLHKIRSDEARLGMFVHALDGSWFDHPFVRSSFLLTPRTLQMLRDSDIDSVIIDDARGLGLSAGSPLPSAEPLPPQPETLAPETLTPEPGRNAARQSVPRAFLSHEPTDMARERKRAVQIVARSKTAIISAFDDMRLGNVVRADQLTPLVDEISASMARNPFALTSVTQLKARHEYTYLHSVAVCALMINFARHLELDPQQVEDLGVAGLLHDVGKVAVSDEILNKPGALSKDEMRSVRGHPVAGHRLLASSPGAPDLALELCLRHHEKVDGTGYPGRLSGDELSLSARMGAICDVYDAVTSNRPYKDAWTPCEALTQMQQWKGHFDPALLDRFADSLGIYAVGTLVRLSTGELGVVVGSAGEADEDVVVRAFFDCETLSEIEPIDRAVAPSAEHPRIIGRDSPSFWRFHDWDVLRFRILAGDDAASPDQPIGPRGAKS